MGREIADKKYYQKHRKRLLAQMKEKRKKKREFFRKEWKALSPTSSYIDPRGYRVLVFLGKIKCYEHRWQVMKKLNKWLEPWQEIHHINGKRDDNRLSNLEVRPEHGHWLTIKRLLSENKRLKKENKQLKHEIRKSDPFYYLTQKKIKRPIDPALDYLKVTQDDQRLGKGI